MKKIRKGIRARGLTHIFNITSELRLGDPVKLHKEGGDVVQKVSQWIDEDPVALWEAIHRKGATVSLVRPAYSLLKEAIRTKCPHLYRENERKKLEKKVKMRLREDNASKKPSTPG